MRAETRPARRAPAQWLQLLAVTAAALASMATSKGVEVRRRYPVWEVAQPAGGPPHDDRFARTETPAFEKRAGDQRVAAWISRSGKEGLGLTLEVNGAPGTAPTVDLREARLEIDNQQIAGSWRPFQPAAAGPPGASAPTPPAGRRQYLYVAFPFDNNRAWNQGVRRGLLHLQLVLGGIPVEPWSIPLVQLDRGDSEWVPEARHRQRQLERERERHERELGRDRNRAPRGPSALEPIDAGGAP